MGKATTSMAKQINRRNTPAAAPAKPAAAPPAPPKRPTFTARWQAWRTPSRVQALAAVIVMSVAFFVALRLLAPHRSFHQDELTNIRMHALREKGIAAEEQHRTFHNFYAWWLEGHFTESGARLPSTVAVTLSLLLLAALAGRLGGHRAAVAAAVLYLCWPRAWDDGLEMRYYGLVMLCSLVGLHALLSLFRGAALWPFLTMALLFAALRHWHPTAIPFHLSLLAIAMTVCAARATKILTTKRPDNTPLPWRRLGPALAVVLIGVAGIALVAPRLAADLKVGKLLEAGEGIADWGLAPTDLIRWLFGWVDDRLSLATPAVRTVRLGFLALVAFGTWRLARHHSRFAVAGAILLLSQFAAAALVQHSWSRLAIGYKYMTSSSAVLLLAMALGLGALAAWAQRQRPARRWGVFAALLAFYFVPLAPRLGLAALGDGSHFRDAWTRIFALSGDKVPLVIGRAEFTQSEWGYRRLIPDFQAMVWPEEDIGPLAMPYLSVRRRPVFLAYDPDRRAAIESTGNFEFVESYRSNFTPTWDFDLYTKKGDIQIAAGGWADLKPGTSILIAETGRWEMSGAATLEGWPSTETRAEVKAGTLLRVQNAAPLARLIPDFTQTVTRQGAFAQKGEMDRWNRIIRRDGRGVYSLSNNYSIEYDLMFPHEHAYLEVATRVDDPVGGGMLLELDDELVGLYALPTELTAGTMAVYRMEIPDRFAGRGVVATLTNLAENSARDADSPKVRVTTIESLSIVAKKPEEQISPNHLSGIELAAPPAFAPNGEINLATALKDRVFDLLSEATKGEMWIEDGHFCVSPANPSAYQNVFTPRWPVKPNTYLVPEVEVRVRNLRSTNLVPVVHLYDAAGKTVKSDTFSAMPVSRTNVDWVRRLGLVLVPERAVSASLMFYVNDDKNEPNPPDGAFEFRVVRLGRYDGK